MCIVKSIFDFRNHLGQDLNASVKAVTTAIKKYGYYSYFGYEHCKGCKLEDLIERASNDDQQQGKNGHLFLFIVSFTQYFQYNDLLF